MWPYVNNIMWTNDDTKGFDWTPLDIERIGESQRNVLDVASDRHSRLIKRAKYDGSGQ